MELEALRKQLDQIDAELVTLTEQRLKICEQVAAYKLQNKKPVLDQTREQQKLMSIREQVQEERYQDAVEHLFIQIMQDSRELQSVIINQKTMERDR